MMQGKKFYKDFQASKEGIATNILSNRLKKLEQHGIVEWKVFEQLKTKKEYSLTEKGKDLIPVLLDIIVWSNAYQEDLAVSDYFVKRAKEDREGLVATIRARLE